MYCPKCGLETTEQALFCAKCGASLKAASTGSGSRIPFGERAQIPPEIRGWNWGAFFLGWIWGVSHRVWIALLQLIPIPLVGIIMAFVLGAKGNEWAWDSRKWDNVAHFKKAQRNWAYAGFAVAGVIVIALVILIAVAAATD